MRLNLRGKIILPTLCLFVLTTSLSLFFMERQIRSELNELVTERLESELRTVRVGLNSIRDSIIMDLEGTALIRPVHLLLAPALPEKELKETLTVMQYSLDTKPFVRSDLFREISLIDRQGRIIISSAKGRMPFTVYKPGQADTWNLTPELPKVRDAKLFEAVLRDKKVAVGSPVDIETPPSAADPSKGGKAFVPFAVPVLDKTSGDVIGVIEAYVNFAVISDKYVDPVKIKSQGEAIISSDGGLIIDNGNFTMRKPGPTWRTPIWIKNKKGVDDYVFADKRWLALYDTDDTTRWTTTIKVLASEVFEPINAIILFGRIANAVALGVVVCFLFLITLFLVRDLKKAVTFADQVADGNLRQTLDIASKDEVGQLAGSLNRMVHSLRELIDAGERQTKEAVEQTERAECAVQEAETSRLAAEKARTEGVRHAASQLESLVNSLNGHAATLEQRITKAAQGAEQQRRQSEENIHALDRMNATVQKVGQSAAGASHSSSDARNLAEGGVKAVADVARAIQEVNAQAVRLKESLNALGTRAEGIGQIMSVISDIADQTNLLALNAAIEAARAGDAGRGFAVVADEVRKLAEKTMSATREVGDSVSAIQVATQTNISMMDATSRTVDQTTSLATGAGDALLAIVEAVKNNAAQIESIAAAGMEQEENSKTITHGIEAVDGISATTTQLMTEARKNLEAVTQATNSLNALLQNLKR